MLQFCAEKGGWLAEIFSLEEQASINDTLLDGIGYWIGLTDSAEEGHFVWQHSNQSLSWSNWKKGEPNNVYNNQNCVVMINDTLTEHCWQWDDYYCDLDQWPVGGNSFIHALCEFWQ